MTRHVWDDSKEKNTENLLSRSGKQLYGNRKETIERSFADAKELHGFRYFKAVWTRECDRAVTPNCSRPEYEEGGEPPQPAEQEDLNGLLVLPVEENTST